MRPLNQNEGPGYVEEDVSEEEVMGFVLGESANSDLPTIRNSCHDADRKKGDALRRNACYTQPLDNLEEFLQDRFPSAPSSSSKQNCNIINLVDEDEESKKIKMKKKETKPRKKRAPPRKRKTQTKKKKPPNFNDGGRSSCSPFGVNLDSKSHITTVSQLQNDLLPEGKTLDE